LTLIPGLMAALMMALLVKERARTPVPHVSFGASLRALPLRFRRLLLAVGLFGLGDFAHSMLILLATQRLASRYGLAGAATIATALYVLHNLLYAGSSLLAGVWGDRAHKGRLLALGYAIAAVMATMAASLPLNVAVLSGVFALGGVYVAMSETLEDAFSAELVDRAQHGMAFGTLATINGVGDFASSIIVGVLWTRVGIGAAFGYSAVLFGMGTLLIWRLSATEREVQQQ
jgi:MFS family permease